MDKKNTYFSIIKKLDEILPSTVELDYTTVNPEELWEKIYNLLDSVGLVQRMSESDLNDLKSNIIYFQGSNYGKTHTVMMNVNSEFGFDQNNYFVKNNVVSMRNAVMKIIEKKCIISWNEHYDDRCGTVEEIDKIVAPDEIRKYIVELLTFTKEKNDSYRIETSMYVKDILLRYGLFCGVSEKEMFFGGETQDDKLYKRLDNLIEDAILKAANLVGDFHSDFGYEGVAYNSKKLNSEMSKVADKIIELVVQLSTQKLNKRKRLDVEKEARKKETKKQSVMKNSESKLLLFEDDLMKEIDLDIPSNNKSNISEGNASQQDTLISLEDDFDEMMLKYEEMKKLIDRNKNLVKMISELEKQKQELLKELNENNKIIQSGVSHGSK